MRFTSGDKFTGFIDFAISVVINAIGFVAGDFVGCPIGIVVNPIGCPPTNFG